MSDDLQETVQRVVGWLSAVAFMALAYLSMTPQYELSTVVVVGVLVMIAMLLGKVDALTGLIESWRK